MNDSVLTPHSNTHIATIVQHLINISYLSIIAYVKIIISINILKKTSITSPSSSNNTKKKTTCILIYLLCNFDFIVSNQYKIESFHFNLVPFSFVFSILNYNKYQKITNN
jgi:hypothetical protein